MAIYRFNKDQRFDSLEERPDFRSDIEQESSPIQIYDHFNPDISMAERRAKEVLDVSGAWVQVYLKMPDRGAPGTYNEVWQEDSGPVFGNAIPMKAYFKPDAQHIEHSRWGIDTSLKLVITFLRSSLLTEPQIGDRLIRVGDQIEIPYNDINEKNWPMRLEVIDTVNDGNFRYRWLYWRTVCAVTDNDEVNRIKHA